MSGVIKKSKSSEGWVEFLSSTRLAIYLLIGITLACVAGIFLPQKGVTLDSGAYLRMIEQPAWQMLDRLGFLDVFRSVWFISLIAMMTVNLIFCSYKGLKRVEKRISKSPMRMTETQAVHQSFFRVWREKSADPKFIKNALAELGNIQDFSGKETVTSRYQKGSLSLYAPFVIHGSIILMIFGAIIDGFSGVDARMNIPEGSASDVISVFSSHGGVERYHMPFHVRCDDFDLELYPGTNRPKDYRSTLTIFENGQEMDSKTIEVNDPFEWRGFRFFQSSYGLLQNQAAIEVTRIQDGQKQNLLLPPMQTVEVPDFEDKSKTPGDNQLPEAIPGLIGVALLDLHDNFQGHGKAVKLSILREDGTQEPFWLFLDTPDYDDQRNGHYKFQLKQIQSGYYTGLMVVKKPGALYIWIGCTLFMVALCWGYLVPYRRAWISYVDGTIILAGTSNRSKETWSQRLADLADRLEEQFGTPEKKS